MQRFGEDVYFESGSLKLWCRQLIGSASLIYKQRLQDLGSVKASERNWGIYANLQICIRKYRNVETMI